MRKIILRGSSICVGTDFAEPIVVPDDTTDEELDRMAWDASVDNAEMYGHYPNEFRPDDRDLTEEEEDSYGDIDYYWEEYNGDEHDGYRCGGGSFEDEFERLMK